MYGIGGMCIVRFDNADTVAQAKAASRAIVELSRVKREREDGG